jgi:hypothetical protein
MNRFHHPEAAVANRLETVKYAHLVETAVERPTAITHSFILSEEVVSRLQDCRNYVH